jgi:SAM-dependent methyltransferase
MVERAPRGVESLSTEPRNAYEGVAAAWAGGPAAMYDKLASVAITSTAKSLRGASVLDVGAGTGALCRALKAAGAVPIAVDMSGDMLGLIGDVALGSVVGDMCALPFCDNGFDAAVSGFAISHIDTPERALAEMSRVVRPSGQVIAAVFGEVSVAASKDAVDEVARNFGFDPPAWYVQLKTRTEPRSNTPALLGACARAAGLQDIDVADLFVDSGLDTPESIAAYRTGLAHLAPFVASLPGSQRDDFLRRAVAAVRERGQPVRPRVLVLSSRAPA